MATYLRIPCVPVVPNPTQLAAYRWLLRYLFANGDATPPPEPARPTPRMPARVSPPAAESEAA